MSLDNVEKVGTSFPDVQFGRRKRCVPQNFNNSTCSVCNKDATDKYVSCSERHIQIH